jgi:hypothetical protein
MQKLTASIIQGTKCLVLWFEEKTLTPMIVEEGEKELFFPLALKSSNFWIIPLSYSMNVNYD